MQERLRLGVPFKGCKHLTRGQCHRHRNCAASEQLSKAGNVGLQLQGSHRRLGAEAPEASKHFISNDRDAKFLAHLHASSLLGAAVAIMPLCVGANNGGNTHQ